MLMLSESTGISNFLDNNFNALEQGEGFSFIHIQSSLKVLCDECYIQISAQERNYCSHHCMNPLE